MDMVLVSKFKAPNQGDYRRPGRPSRTSFCLRIYGHSNHIGLPSDECGESDRIDFFVSSTGFAIKISPNGERAISKPSTGKFASLPRKIVRIIPNLQMGVTELIASDIGNRTWFFPFSQF